MKTIGLITCFLLSAFTVDLAQPAEPVVVTVVEEPTVEKSVQDEIFEVLIENGLDTLHARLIVCQAIHESGNFRNNLTVNHNNVFARLHSSKDTLSLGPLAKAEGRRGYASYKSVRDATISQVQYLKRKNYSFKWDGATSFAYELKRRKYYEDSPKNYARSIYNIYKNNYL